MTQAIAVAQHGLERSCRWMEDGTDRRTTAHGLFTVYDGSHREGCFRSSEAHYTRARQQQLTELEFQW